MAPKTSNGYTMSTAKMFDYLPKWPKDKIMESQRSIDFQAWDPTLDRSFLVDNFFSHARTSDDPIGYETFHSGTWRRMKWNKI